MMFTKIAKGNDELYNKLFTRYRYRAATMGIMLQLMNRANGVPILEEDEDLDEMARKRAKRRLSPRMQRRWLQEETRTTVRRAGGISSGVNTSCPYYKWLEIPLRTINDAIFNFHLRQLQSTYSPIYMSCSFS